MRFTRNNALKNHVEIVHEGKKPWKCSQCPPEGAHDSSFSRVEGLQIHLKNKHGKTNDEIQAMVEEQMSFKCDECNRGFTNGKHLNFIYSDNAIFFSKITHFGFDGLRRTPATICNLGAQCL